MLGCSHVLCGLINRITNHFNYSHKRVFYAVSIDLVGRSVWICGAEGRKGGKDKLGGLVN